MALSLPAAPLAFQRLFQQVYEVLLETSPTQEQRSHQAFLKSCGGCHKTVKEFEANGLQYQMVHEKPKGERREKQTLQEASL